MELKTITQPAIVQKQGTVEEDLTQNQNILLKLHNNIVLNTNVPSGKNWHIVIQIIVTEEDN